MKRKLFSLLALTFVIVMSLLMFSCGKDEDRTGIKTEGFLSENGIYKITVENSVKSFDVLSKIEFEKKTEYTLSSNKNFSNEIKNGVVNLKEGDNYVYLKVTDKKDHESVYTFNIYRKKMVTVTFNTNGGVMSQNKMVVQEGTTISQPTASKAGHTLSWDYDFKKPITSNITINAVWTPYDCVIKANVNGQITTHYLLFGEVPSNLPSLDIFGYSKSNSTGWLYGDVEFDPTAPYTYSETSIEITAALEPIKFDIIYNIDGNVTNNVDNVNSFTVVTPDGTELKIELKAPTHSSEDYVFVGWSLSENSKETIEFIDMELLTELGKTTINFYPVWDIYSDVEYSYGEGVCEKDTDRFMFGAEYELPVPTLEDFAFEGWYHGSTLVSNKGTWSLKEDVELTAKWTRIANDVHYVLNTESATNDENPTSFEVADGEIELKAPVHSSPNYVFVGWYSNPNFSEDSLVTKLTPSMVENIVLLYAKWDVTSNVTLDPTEGSCDNTNVQLKYDNEYTLPIPTRDKYDFDGWYYEDTKVEISGIWKYDIDVDLVAKWKPTNYKINYVTNGGVANDNNSGSFNVETKIEDLVFGAPTKEFNEFKGWYLDAEFTISVESFDPTAYDSDVTFYAKWEVKKVTINYDANGGDVAQTQVVVNLGDNYKLLVPVKSGYNFGGWLLDGNAFDSEGRLTDENLTVLNLLAKWDVIEYTISYDLNGGFYGGTLVEKYSVESNDIKLPRPTRTGYHFAGWSLDGGYANMDVVINKGCVGDRSYKALWAAKKDSNGLLYSMINDKLVVVGIDRVIDSTIKAGIKIPSSVEGVEVVAIESNAFKEFGEKFVKTSYANLQSGYVTFSIPTTVKRIGASAFETCNGIKVELYDPNGGKADYKAWDKTTIWEPGNKAARDCIWGFRPAIGWTRYSKVEIPDDYE